MGLLLALGVVALALGVWVSFTLLEGWAISVLWGWFAVPAGLPPISVLTAIGLSITAAVLTHQYIPTPKAATAEAAWAEFTRRVSDFVSRVLLYLLSGWLFRLILS